MHTYNIRTPKDGTVPLCASPDGSGENHWFFLAGSTDWFSEERDPVVHPQVRCSGRGAVGSVVTMPTVGNRGAFE